MIRHQTLPYPSLSNGTFFHQFFTYFFLLQLNLIKMKTILMELETPAHFMAKVLKNFHFFFWGGGASLSNCKGSLFDLHPSISPLLSRIQILDLVPHSQSSKVTCSLFLLFSLLSGQSKGCRTTNPFSVILSSPYFG